MIGGITPKSLEVATAMYGHFIETLVPVASTDAAEMVKLLENTFRAVNIGLVNEVAIMCGKLGLDTWEVIQAAATKPFGFMPFYPGPGLGGHCIPIDPLYLSWKLKTLKYNARFIELADEINSPMPEFVEVMVADALNARRKAVRGSRILVCGVAYKRDIDDVRESPALDIIELLQRRGAEVDYSDPYAPTLRIGEHQMKSVPIETAGTYDCVLITTDHRNVDYAALCDRAQLVVDTRNATRALREKHADKIVSLVGVLPRSQGGGQYQLKPSMKANVDVSPAPPLLRISVGRVAVPDLQVHRVVVALENLEAGGQQEREPRVVNRVVVGVQRDVPEPDPAFHPQVVGRPVLQGQGVDPVRGGPAVAGVAAVVREEMGGPPEVAHHGHVGGDHAADVQLTRIANPHKFPQSE